MRKIAVLFVIALVPSLGQTAETKSPPNSANEKTTAKVYGKSTEQSSEKATELAEDKFSKAPFASPEDVVFLKKEDQKFLDLQKNDSFLGIIRRLSVTKKELHTIDLYGFKEIEKVKITEELCREVLAKIFGPLDQISLQLKKTEIVETDRFGNSCEAILVDPDRAAAFAERYVYVSSIHAQIYALVFRFPKTAMKADKEDMRTFIQSLK